MKKSGLFCSETFEYWLSVSLGALALSGYHVVLALRYQQPIDLGHSWARCDASSALGRTSLEQRVDRPPIYGQGGFHPQFWVAGLSIKVDSFSSALAMNGGCSLLWSSPNSVCGTEFRFPFGLFSPLPYHHSSTLGPRNSRRPCAQCRAQDATSNPLCLHVDPVWPLQHSRSDHALIYDPSLKS